MLKGTAREQNDGDCGPAIDARFSHPIKLAIRRSDIVHRRRHQHLSGRPEGHDPHADRATREQEPLVSGVVTKCGTQFLWSAALALNPLDSSLYFVYDRFVLKPTYAIEVKRIESIPVKRGP
uniref:Uncharacterized protein n=1 Tax=Anopheles atroparvus TaxID=41427 RepID=A0A182J5R5_ANOAO